MGNEGFARSTFRICRNGPFPATVIQPIPFRSDPDDLAGMGTIQPGLPKKLYYWEAWGWAINPPPKLDRPTGVGFSSYTIVSPHWRNLAGLAVYFSGNPNWHRS